MRYICLTFLLLIFFPECKAQLQFCRDSSLNGALPQCFAIQNNTLIFSDERNIFTIDKFGQTKALSLEGLPQNKRLITKVAAINDTIFAFNYFGECHKTGDLGANWTICNINGIPGNSFDNYPDLIQMESLIIYNENASSYYSFNGSDWIFLCNTNEIKASNANRIAIYNSVSDFSVVYDNSLIPIDTIYEVGTTNDDLHYGYYYDLNDSLIYRQDLTDPALPISPVGQLIGDASLQNGITYTIKGRTHLITAWYFSVTGNNMLQYYLSDDDGQNWYYRHDLAWMGYSFPMMQLANDTLIAYDEQNAGFRISYDAGMNWLSVADSIKGLYYEGMENSPQLDTLFWIHAPNMGASLSKGIFRSANGGISWENINSGIPSNPSSTDSSSYTYSIYNLTRCGNDYYAIINDINLYHSSNSGNNWQPVTLSGLELRTIVGKDENTFFISAKNLSSGLVEFFKTDDHGVSWQNINMSVGVTSGFIAPRRHFIEGKNDTLILQFNQYYQNPFDHFRLYRSVDQGQSWQNITPANTESNANKRLGANDGMSRVITGRSFGSSANFLIQIVESRDTTNVNRYLFPSEFHDSLYLFHNDSWTIINHTGLPSDIDMHGISYYNSVWYLSSNYGMFESMDNGISWNSSRSTDVGFNNGFNLKTMNGNLVCATKGFGIWIKSIPLGINEKVLRMNVSAYPNPTSKNISFTSESDSFSSITIFDTCGKLVGNFSFPSCHTKNLDLSQLENGMYFYSVENGKSVGKFMIQK